MDKKGKPFILEALPLELEELSQNEVQLLYLQKSIQTEETIWDLVFFIELWQFKTIGKTVMAVEEDNENVNLEKAADAVMLLENFL